MPNAAGMAQLNVRIDPEVKAAAEANMERLGISATEVVRSVYEWAAQSGTGISKIVSALIDPLSEQLSTEETINADVLAQSPVIERIDAAWNNLYLELGLDPNNLPEFRQYSDEELMEMYWDDRDRERGLGIYAKQED